jgi:hypothetical protein
MYVLCFEIDIGVSGGRKCGMHIFDCTTSPVAKGATICFPSFKKSKSVPSQMK